MTSKAVLIALLSVVTLCHGVTTFLHPGKEFIYDYHAKINVGTYKPTTFESQFFLNGKLHLQHEQNSVLMKFSDMTFELYNGEFNDHTEQKRLPLSMPKETEDLLNTFQVMYNDDGKIKYFEADMHEKKFSQDLKKAVASIMQLDMKEINFDSKLPYIFTTHEDSVYGKLQVRYNIIPKESEMIIKKMLNVQKSSKWFNYFGVTDNDRHVDLISRKAMSVDSHREYHLMKDDTHYHMKEINAEGGIYTHILKESETEYMLVKQKMKLLEMIPIKEKLTMAEETIKGDLTFKLNIDENDESLVDLSLGRNEMKMEKYEKIISDDLDKVVTYLKFNHLKAETPDLRSGQLINHLLRKMSMVNLNTLEKMYTTLEEKTGDHDQEMFQVFQKMIPLIGTRASIIFTRNLIRKQKVTDEMAISMLMKMPFNLRMPSEKLLTEVEDLMNMEKVSPKVHNAAMLSFSSLIHKVYSHFLINNQLVQHSKEHKKDDLLEKYILKFMELLKSAPDYSTQYLYMNALYNIQIGNVIKYLEPYVTGKETTNRHLRYLAMCASFIEAIKNPERVYEIYWPIFTDPTLHLELRAGAYFTIMSTIPSRAKLLSIYWILKQDPCPDLYHLHYTYMRSIVHSTEVTLQEYKEMVSELLNFMREPYRHPLTGIYIADYMSPKYGFGAMNSAMFLSTNTSKTMYLDFTNNLYSIPVRNYALWFKIDGVDTTMVNEISNNKNMQSTSTMEQIMNIIFSLKDQKDLHIEYAILHNNKVIQMDYVSHSTIDKFKMDLFHFMNSNSLDISYTLITQQIMPNDLGLPVLAELLIPSVHKIKFQATDEKIDGTSIKEGHLKLQLANHAMYGMSFYNPVANVRQGIERIETSEMITSLNYKLSITKEMKFKITINNLDDDTTDKMTMRNYATTLTYIFGDLNNLLQQSSKNSQHFEIVSKGSQYRKSKMILEHDCPHTGLLFQIEVFNSEHHVSRRTIMEHLHSIFQKYSKNYQTMPLGYFLLTMQNAMQFLQISPIMGTYGTIIRVIPSKKYPVNRMELSFRMNREIIHEKNSFEKLTKFNVKTALTTKTKEDQVIRSWNINAMLDMNLGHMINNYKIHYSMIMPNEKDYKMCITGVQKWMNIKMVGHFNMTMGHTDDLNVCVDNEGLIEIDMKGEQSDEQHDMMKNKMTYDKCIPKHMHEPLLEGLHINYENDVECTMRKTSIRKYEYDIKSTGLSDHFLEKYHCIKNYLKGMLFPYYSNEKVNNPIDDHSMKIMIDFPAAGNEMDMEIMTKYNKHTITEVPTTILLQFGFHPQTYHYSYLFARQYFLGMVKSCLIANQHIFNDNNEVIELKDNDWMTILKSKPNVDFDHTMEIFMKQTKDQKHMDLKIKMNEQVMEIIPEGDNYKIMLNEKPLQITKNSYHQQEWFSIGMLDDEHYTIIMHMYNFPLYISFDGENMKIDKAITNMKMKGLCFVH